MDDQSQCCRRCGALLVSGDVYCAACGAPTDSFERLPSDRESYRRAGAPRDRVIRSSRTPWILLGVVVVVAAGVIAAFAMRDRGATEAASVASDAPLPTPTAPLGFVKFTDEAEGFAISYPPDWVITTSWAAEEQALLEELWEGTELEEYVNASGWVFSAELAPADDLGPSMSIEVNPVIAGTSASRYSEGVDQTMRDTTEGFVVHSKRNVVLGDVGAIISDWEIPYSGYPGLAGVEGRFRTIDLMITDGEAGWTVSCSVDIAAAVDDLETCEAIITSFRLLP